MITYSKELPGRFSINGCSNEVVEERFLTKTPGGN